MKTFNQVIQWVFIICVMAVVFAGNAKADQIDIRPYFIGHASVQVYAKSNGVPYVRHTWIKNDTRAKKPFWKTRLKGDRVTWGKDYWVGGKWVTKATQPMLFGNNAAIMELGGFKPTKSGVEYVGYSKNGKTTGLFFSGKGGLFTDRITAARQSVMIGSKDGLKESRLKAFSKAYIVAVLPEFTPEYGTDENGNFCQGCSKTYYDVVVMRFIHGTKTDGKSSKNCNGQLVYRPDLYYQPVKDYKSYSQTRWMAKGIGIIQRQLDWSEDRSHSGKCFGARYSNSDSVTYLK